MCVLAFAWQAHPRWRIVAAGNRDESHARPSAPLARWEEPGHVIAGKDLLSGGTWLGVSEQGRFAVVTNVKGHGETLANRPSRGALVRDVVSDSGAHASPSDDQIAMFNSFNLISVADGAAWFLSNRPGLDRRRLRDGIYGLSNDIMDRPAPRTIHLQMLLQEWLDAGSGQAERLLDVLGEDRLPPLLSESDEAGDRMAAPIFMRNAVYGTRCSTVVLVDVAGDGVIVERRFSSLGEAVGDTAIPFTWHAGDGTIPEPTQYPKVTP